MHLAVQHVVRHAGRRVARVDLADAERRVAVQDDGGWHALTEQLEEDRRRLDQIHAAGRRVVHITATDRAQPGRALALVRAAIDRASRPATV